MTSWGDLILDILCRKERKNDYLRRIEEINKDVARYSGDFFEPAFDKIVGKSKNPQPTHEEDLTERVRALVRFTDVSLQAWKSAGLADVAIEFGGAWRTLKAKDCEECGCMPPWHAGSCSHASNYRRIGHESSAAGARNGD